MKRIILSMALICASISANAQHHLQIDDGAGNISIIQPSATGGTYTLPAGGGTLTVGSTIPDQTGNSGEFLTTDGSNLSWGTPSGSGTNNIAWGGHTNSVGNGQKHYAMPNGFIGAVTAGNEDNVCVIVPVTCSVTSLFVRFSTAPDAGSLTAGNQEYVIRVRNRTDNTVSAGVTISESQLTGNSVSLSLAFDAGDEMNIEFDPTGSTTNNPTTPGRVAFGVLAIVP